MLRTVGLALLVLAPAAPAASEFDHAVHWVESQYGVSRVHVPMLGFASFMVRVAGGPIGARDFRMAIFEGDSRPSHRATALGDLGFGWRTVLRVTHKNGDDVEVYGRDESGWEQLLMVTRSGRDAVVMQFRLRPSKLMEFVANQSRDHH